jgi:hypothetical protein
MVTAAARVATSTATSVCWSNLRICLDRQSEVESPSFRCFLATAHYPIAKGRPSHNAASKRDWKTMSALPARGVEANSKGALQPAHSLDRLPSGVSTAKGESDFKTQPDGKKQSLAIQVLNAPAVLVGRFLNWMATPDEPSHDGFRHGRLRHFEKKHPDAAKHPDLSEYSDYPGVFRFRYDDPPHGPVMVFIHGTFSCTLPNLAQLSQLKIPVYRFEHDTFQSVSSNAKSLVKAISGYLRKNDIHFVAHSRGGLVARLVARELAAQGQHITVRTYGTPHKGTPLANLGGRGSRLFSRWDGRCQAECSRGIRHRSRGS